MDTIELTHVISQGVGEDVDRITLAPYAEHQAMSREHGKVYAHWKMGMCTVTVADPDLAEAVLSKEWDRIIEGDRFPTVFLRVVDDSIFGVGGARWKKMRKATGPPAIRGLKRMGEPMAANTLGLVSDLLSQTGQSVDMATRLRKLQVENVAAVMFKGAFGDREEESVGAVCEFLDMWIELNKHRQPPSRDLLFFH